ncbi:uncharacterized protein LOC134716611 [Mytilus trossulus]|uniref:uncharacterized protein LOC134716611 n=1 Tax=Mytilus trossulus TaxID=6551 RepID=UPI003006670C
MMTAICKWGQAEDMLITRLNRVGVTLSPTSKQRLIKKAGEISHKALCDYLKEKPLLKITGDNLDIYIKSCCVSIDKGNTDFHLFASNALTSRLSSVDMDNRTPVFPEVNGDVLKLTETEIDNMKYSYSILKTFKAFYKMDSMDKLGTLAFWRNRPKKTDINGKVKSHFNLHSKFFKLIVRELIREQADTPKKTKQWK